VIENDADNPGALVIDGHGRADLGVVRALGERGVPVYLATNDFWTPVNRSRFVRGRFAFPDRSKPESERISALVSIGRQFAHRPVFFSTGDSSLLLFSRHRSELEPFFLHHLARADLLEELNDKRRFATFAQAQGLPVPASLAPESLDALKSGLQRLRFPVIVKPAEKRNWDRHPEIDHLVRGDFKGVKVATPEELVRLYEALTPYDNRVVIQDYIEGRDEEIFSLHIFIDRNGNPRGWFTGQKIRTYPIHRGVGCFQLSVINRDVYRVGLEALQKIGYTGHAIVQVKRAPERGTFLIMEINCRYSTWNYLHTRAGVNEPYLAYRDSRGLDVPVAPEQIEGARWIDATNDIKAFAAYRRIGEWSTLAWLRTYVGRNCYAVFAWNDLRPWLGMVLWRWLRVRVPAGSPKLAAS
jgi:predicted ATP-grasp superfamily ATP-dependent carboligase